MTKRIGVGFALLCVLCLAPTLAPADNKSTPVQSLSVPIDASTQTAIDANLTLVEEKFGGEASLDLKGVAYMDGFIRRMPKAVREKPGRLIGVLGSHLGQSLVRTYKGRWIKTPEGYIGVRMGPMFEGGTELTAFPFAKVGKHIANGQEDSILSFFQIAGRLLKEKASATRAK